MLENQCHWNHDSPVARFIWRFAVRVVWIPAFAGMTGVLKPNWRMRLMTENSCKSSSVINVYQFVHSTFRPPVKLSW
jgi:hypothetical protein